MRYAIYFTPPPEHPLSQAAAAWLGRDAFTDAQIELGYGHHVPRESASRYGFHATMKAPFRLRESEDGDALIERFGQFCADCGPVRLDPVRLGLIDGFFAIVTDHNPALAALEKEIVTGFDDLRAPLSEAEIARRNPHKLDTAQAQHLACYGYPHVLDRFFFHMTLTDRIAPPMQADARAAIERHFGDLLTTPIEIATLAIFMEAEPGAPFTVLRLCPLGRAARGV